MAKPAQAVATSQESLPPKITGLPEGLSLEELEADAGIGTSDLGMDDVAVSYIYVLQSNSPQVNPDHESYIEGAQPGMFLNNVTREIFDGRKIGLTVIPCAYERKFVEWVDRDEGGGYVRDYEPDDPIVQTAIPVEGTAKLKLPNGHLLVDTAYHYVYMQNPNNGRWEEVIIPMKSTFLRKSRQWNHALMKTYLPNSTKRAMRWLYPYQLKTVKETKNNNTWSNIDIIRGDAMVSAEQYRACKAFAELFAEGNIVRAKETQGLSDVGGGGRGSMDDSEIPF